VTDNGGNAVRIDCIARLLGIAGGVLREPDPVGVE